MSLGTRDLVSNAPIREAWERWGMTISEFARRMGFVTHRPHVQRARKLLGLAPDHRGRGPGNRREHMDYANALRACEALGLDPVDLGL